MAKNVSIERQDLKDHPSQDVAAAHLEEAALSLKPFGFEYQASFAVHLYQIAGQNVFSFVLQPRHMGIIPEQEADAALKEARRALMAIYGREERKREAH